MSKTENFNINYNFLNITSYCLQRKQRNGDEDFIVNSLKWMLLGSCVRFKYAL